jgi:hypothetical protein
LLRPLVFGADELAELRFKAHLAPGVEGATVFLRDRLAEGPQSSTDLIAAGAGAGLCRSSLYRAKRRLGLASDQGIWSLPVSTTIP